MSVQVGLVDYGMGNRRSVQKALEHVGAHVVMTADPSQLERCQGLVVPGVGAFPQAMSNLRELGLIEPLTAMTRAGTPLLGICLGMQLLFESSDELAPTPGLGLLPGRVERLSGRERLPHIGWNEVSFERFSSLLEGLPRWGCPFYHVHSLAARPVASDIVGTAEYGERFATIVERENVAGVQFHPEKSSAHGLRLLANFVRGCEKRSAAPAPGIAA